MTGCADANLVLAAGNPRDALHARAVAHLRSAPRLRVPFSVGIELLYVAVNKGHPAVAILADAARAFDVDDMALLLVAAQALDKGDVPTPFDAVHLATAFVSGEALHTADRRLHRTRFPTVPF